MSKDSNREEVKQWLKDNTVIREALAFYHASEGHVGEPYTNADSDIKDLLTHFKHQLQKACGEAVREFASNLRVLVERGNTETAMNIIIDHSELDQDITKE